MLERDIEKRVCDYAKSKGFLVYKFTSPNRAAVPDRMFVTPSGVVFFVEFKAPGKKPTPAQKREHERLENQGMRVWVVDDVEQGKKIVDQSIPPWQR